MTLEVDEPVAAVAGRRRVLPRVPVGPLATPDKQNAVTMQCCATSVEVPITLLETAGSPGANHKECSERYTVISASNKDMSNRGVWGNEARSKRPALLSPHIN